MFTASCWTFTSRAATLSSNYAAVILQHHSQAVYYGLHFWEALWPYIVSAKVSGKFSAFVCDPFLRVHRLARVTVSFPF